MKMCSAVSIIAVIVKILPYESYEVYTETWGI